MQSEHHEFEPNYVNNTQAQAMMALIRQTAPLLLQRVQKGFSNLELVYTPHPTWPFPHSDVLRPYSANSPLRISILDSSFNPPTLAHLALANSRRYQDTIQTIQKDDIQPAYDAKLLLLSVRNADKTLQPGDATYQQRLEMMSLLAMDVQPDINEPTARSQTTPKFSTAEHTNVAIAIVDEPTFIGKSDALLAFFKDRFLTFDAAPESVKDIELSFLVGLDTLERVFSPRYYSSEKLMMSSLRKFFSARPEGDNSRIVSAGRVFEPATSQPQDSNPLSLAKEFIDSGRIEVIDLGDDISTYSSSTVRRSRNSVGGQNSLWRKLVTKNIAEYIDEHQLYHVGL